MSSYLRKLVELQKINTPTWLPDNVMFEGLTGSVAYGVSNDTSDMDLYSLISYFKSINPEVDIRESLRETFEYSKILKELKEVDNK